jgi:hypothetical protein
VSIIPYYADMLNSKNSSPYATPAVRVRPLSERDRAIPRFSNMSESDILRIQNTSVYVAPHQKTFTFDYVFGPNSAQDEIFVTLADPLIHKFIDGAFLNNK